MDGILKLMEKVEFPNLFSGSFEINRVAFSVFGIDVYWYGIIIALGVILAFIYAMRRAKKFGLIADHVFDVVFVAIIFGFIGARAYYCIFIDTQINFFDLRHGGLAIYGGIIAAAIAAAVMCVIRKVKLPALFDLGGLGLLIGQCIGRWGNFVNQEAYGAPTAGTLPWGMTGTIIIDDPVVVAQQNALDAAGEGIYALVHPCFLYESLWCLIGFVALHFYSKKLRSFDGEIFLLYVTWYGLGRFWIEGLRTDSLYIGDTGIRVSQLIAGISAIIALGLFIFCKLTKTKKKGYTMYKDTALCAERLEAYAKRQQIIEEKEKAKKAMKHAEEQAPSILADDDTSDTAESAVENDSKAESTESTDTSDSADTADNEDKTDDKPEDEAAEESDSDGEQDSEKTEE